MHTDMDKLNTGTRDTVLAAVGIVTLGLIAWAIESSKDEPRLWALIGIKCYMLFVLLLLGGALVCHRMITIIRRRESNRSCS